MKVTGKIFLHSYFSICSKKIEKNLILLDPNIPQFSKQDLERIPLKNNIDSREHVLGVKVGFLGLEIWA